MKRIVVKVGSHVLSENGRLAKKRIDNLISLLSDLMDQYEVILVSSGAVAAGYTRLKLDKSILANKQAIASVGQPHLMATYQKRLDKYGKLSSQILLIADDFDSRKRTQHAKNAIEILLKHKILPIINENDTTATEELVFGDNDQLSAHVAHYFDADLLVILSDIDGYYDKDPRVHSDALMLKVVNKITQDELLNAPSPNNKFATGGIVTKLKAANFLLQNGKKMFLASGFELEDIRSFLLNNIQKKGTLFSPANG